MRSKKDDFKKKQIANWNKQASPRVRPVTDQIKIVLSERKLKQALTDLEYRRNMSERECLIKEGLIKPGKES